MRFIKSNFEGQLPKLFENDDPNETRIIHKDFNDLNKEEKSRYIIPEKCHYLVDSKQAKPSKLEPDYSKNTKDWTVLSSHKMLDLPNSPVIIRSFYLPFVSWKRNNYVDYQLLRNNLLFQRRPIGDEKESNS